MGDGGVSAGPQAVPRWSTAATEWAREDVGEHPDAPGKRTPDRNLPPVITENVLADEDTDEAEVDGEHGANEEEYGDEEEGEEEGEEEATTRSSTR